MPVAAKHAAPSTKAGPKRKRARGRARTDVSSSESSSDDSSDSSSDDSDSDAGVPSGDVEMADADALSEDESADEEEKTQNARQQTKRIPSPLRDLHDPRPFEEYYMKLVTSEFGDDLDALRKAKDFEEGGVRSLGVLVRALESGVNVFDEDEMRSVVVAGKS